MRPTQGTFVLVAVRLPNNTAGDSLDVEATLAGEPLHFTRERDGVYRALAGVPIDAPDTLHSTVVVQRNGTAAETLAVALPVTRASYPVERLTVAPEFGREPDSLLNARLEEESRRAMAVSANSHQTARLWKAPLARPRPGRVTSGYGRGREYNGVVQSRHMGTDFAGASGTPVRAIARGVVALVDTFYLGGRVLYVDHGAGLVTAYLHLSRAVAAVGDTVERGEVIGRVGATGRVTGPHLHMVARYGKTTLDPMSLLRLLGEAPSARTRQAGKGGAPR
ncbi:MAG TPA: M23 family metallopeptidase [Gemmatimonadaceae bacterium]|nr:M23 family metallopeptidase [Gemmatimonadaceae bacterium]